MERGAGRFIGAVDEAGKLSLFDRAGFVALLRFHAGKRVVIEVAREKKDRSGQQNRYYWGVIIKTLAEVTGYSRDEMHDALRLKFLKGDSREGLSTIKSTAGLSTAEFADYCEQVREWAAVSLGVLIAPPNEGATVGDQETRP